MTTPTIIMPKYQGHNGSATWDAEEGHYYGTVTSISDVVTFISPDVEGLEQAFQDSVDDYVEMIAEADEIERLRAWIKSAQDVVGAIIPLDSEGNSKVIIEISKRLNAALISKDWPNATGRSESRGTDQ